MESLSDKIDRAVSRIRSLGGEKIRFIILYGSACEGGMKDDSDIDICVYYDDADASEFRLKVLSDLFDDIYDIKVFQQLPLPLRKEVLKGWVLYDDDTPFLYDKAYETVKEFESFKPRYFDLPGNRTPGVEQRQEISSPVSAYEHLSGLSCRNQGSIR